MLTLTLSILLTVSSALALFVTKQVFFAIKNYKFHTEKVKNLPIEKIPSVTVCIPARNETHAMTRCLEAVINSDYPKLEILVLDDDSVDNTSILIKSFAHSGVRFIKGSALPDGWIGRNFAYQNLATNANGKYILFMSVDTHIERSTISQMVAYLAHKKVEMISVLPVRLDNYRLSVLFSTFRFFNELVLSSKRNAPVTSGAWLVNRELLKEYVGDLSSYKNDVEIESKIGRAFSERNHYNFLLSPMTGGVSYEKKWNSQVETSIRNYALSTKGHILKQFGLFLFLSSFSLPLVIILYSLLFNYYDFVLITAVVIEIMFCITYSMFAKLSWSRGSWCAFLLFPIAAIQEVIIFVTSIIKRQFGTITWKGRNIYTDKKDAS
jgi:Glycosyltransferases, probably involved in cell wall biogenesis